MINTRLHSWLKLVFFILGIFPNILNAQVDVLELQLINADKDTTKARLWNQIAWEIKFSNPIKSIEYAEKAIKVAYKLNLITELSNGYKAKAHGYLNQKKFVKSMQFYDSAIFYANKSKNNTLIAGCYNKKAGAVGDFGNFDQAISFYTIGLNAALKTNDNNLKQTLCNNIADAYQNTNRNTLLTQKYFKLAIYFAILNKDAGAASLGSANLAKEFSLQLQNDKAKAELIKTIEFLKKYNIKNSLYGIILDVIASVYEDIGELNLAIGYATKSYQILDSLKMPDNKLRPLLVLSSVNFKMGNIQQAKLKATALLTFAIQRGAKVYIKDAYNLLYKIAKQENKSDLALSYFENYKAWNDSVYTMERDKNIAAVEFKSNLAKQQLEAALDLQTKENRNKKLTSDVLGLRIGIIVSLLALFCIAIIGFILFKNNKIKQKLNSELISKNQTVLQQASDKEVLIQEIHHRVKNNLTMLQSLLYLQTKNSENEVIKQVLSESQTRILSMALVHQHLYENDREGTLDVTQFLQSLLEEVGTTFANKTYKNLEFSVTGECSEIGIKTATPLGLVVNELITNSLKYAFNNVEKGSIGIQVSQNNNFISLSYTDSGPGLLKPFTDENNGFGFKIIKLLCKQIKATITQTNTNKGSNFCIRFTV